MRTASPLARTWWTDKCRGRYGRSYISRTCPSTTGDDTFRRFLKFFFFNLIIVKSMFLIGRNRVLGLDPNSAWKTASSEYGQIKCSSIMKSRLIINYIFLIFQLLNGMSRSRSLIVKRTMKKYAQGLLLIFLASWEARWCPANWPQLNDLSWS